MNVTRQIRIDKDEVEKFNRFYPDLLTIFVQRAVFIANRDKDFCLKVITSPLLNEVSEVN